MRRVECAVESVGCVQRTKDGGRCVSRTLLGCVLAAVCFAGCGDRGPERIVVSGTVRFAGKPVGEGMIRFMPVAASAVPMAGAYIQDGKYRIDGRGGVPVGTHKVEIEGIRINMAALKPGQPVPKSAWERGAPRVQYVPDNFNLNSTLKVTIEPGSPEVTKNFDLTK
jgi:hypothetical protein